MSRFIFQSIKHPDKHCYTLDSSLYDTKPYQISGHFRCYDTLGDKNIAHTPDYPVPASLLDDYLFSLAREMMSVPELIDAATFEVRPRVEDAAIEFAEQVRYKEGKTRYYSVSERKVTTADAKRYDKRYHEVTASHDGSVSSIFSILSHDYYEGWQSYVLMWSILNWFRQARNNYMGRTLEQLKWNQPGLISDDLDAAYDTCLSIVRANDLFSGAKRRLKHYVKAFEPAAVEEVG